MPKTLLTIILSLLLFTSVQVNAQWFSVTGEASTRNTDAETARRIAMENALQKALLVAGASVSSVQQVVNGLLTQDQISIRASGIVNSLEIVSETYADDKIVVNIRADIFPQEHQCASADYKKSLLITRTNLLQREHANIGQIYAIDTQLGHRLAAKFREKSQFVDSVVATSQKTSFSRLNNSFQLEKIKQLSMSLAQMTDSQFVMFTELNDISLAKDANNPWLVWQENIYDRRFDMSAYIVNGVNGETIFEKHYQNVAPWDFGKRDNVDVASNVFWQSAYGETVKSTLNKLVSDIDSQLMCNESRGRIVQINNNSIILNIGSKHGVQIGDEFSVLHVANFLADNGRSYAGFNVSPHKVKIMSVSNDTAHATTADGKILGSVQVDDVVVKR
mgnify:CR=1 FL=1